jgi:PilZ domain
MDFHLKNRRLNPRKSCRGPVLVYELASGLPFTGELIDVSRGGVRLALDHRLPTGEAVRVFFPHRKCVERRQGRMIIGRVVHQKPEGNGHIVRIAFGRYVEIARNREASRDDPHPASIFRRFTTSLTPRVLSAWRRCS